MLVKHNKYVNALFIGAAALVWLITKYYVASALGYFQVSRHIGLETTTVLQELVPFLLAVATFAVLRKNKKSYNFVTDSIGEIIKVVWPGKKEVNTGTIVVIVVVLASGLALGVVDKLFSAIVKALINA